MRRKIIVLFILSVIALIFIFSSGYRLDSLSAARANSFIPKDAVLLDQVDYDWGSVFVFNSSEKPITAISLKKAGFLWVSRISVYYFHNMDPIKTIGGVTLANENERATVMSIIVDDPRVTSLEIGPEAERQSKQVILGEPITFSWNKSIDWQDLNPQALDDEGRVRYEYRYAQSNFITAEDLRWYPVES
ncbi:hypothetical protein [Paenibacillus apis]|uniref:Uncharacterized protein n=1 Tax=Paenibacillus apis TaxID=1792174 RepID=A0A920CIH4_9BACL|nr:hypothetical protein [Paenibacillus apis]GIO41621.1 hypothetical protein J41TS4_13790 [Paenibacillus apis]